MLKRTMEQLDIKGIKQKEIKLINKVISAQSQYMSDSEWSDILYEAERSKVIQQALSVLDCNGYNKFIVNMVSPDMYHLLINKENIDKGKAKTIAEHIPPEKLKQILLKEPISMAEIFKEILRNFDFETSKKIDFLNYAVMDNIERQAKEMIRDHSNETKAMIAICNNHKLSDEIRNLAFNTIDDPLLISNYTNYMKTSIYNSVVSQIFDYPQKSINDMKRVDDATEILLHMIENRQLLVSCEYDLLQRLQSSPTATHNRKIMNTLLQHTKDAIILRNAYEFNPVMTKGVIRNNLSCDIFVLEGFISESIKNIKELTKRKTDIIGIISEKDFISNRIFSQPFSLKSYQQLHQYAKKHDELLDNMIILCPYIRTNSLKEIYGNENKLMIQLRERIENEFGKNGIANNKCFDYMRCLVYQIFKKKEEYFNNADAMSLNMFFKQFGKGIENISKKEMKIISSISEEFGDTNLGNEIKTLDEMVKMVYNKENMFGNYRELYSYKNGEYQFNIYNILQNNTNTQKFKQVFLKFADIATLEKLQQEIKNAINNEDIGIAGIYIANNIEFIAKLNDRINEIENALIERQNNICI